MNKPIETFYFSVNPTAQHLISGNLIQFWFIVLLSLFIGLAIYYLTTNSTYRKAAFRSKRALPKALAAMISIAISIVLIGFAYHSNWSRFYQIDIYTEKFTLKYFYPKRQQTLALKDIQTLEKHLQWDKNPELIIRTRNGKSYVSGLTTHTHLQTTHRQLLNSITRSKSP